MKKKDKAALMKIIIGGLVLVGLYFGYQAMSGGGSPFSMAGGGYTGKAGSKADLEVYKSEVIMPSKDRSNMSVDQVAIKFKMRVRNQGPHKAYGAKAVFVLSDNLDFLGNNQPPYNSRGCKPEPGNKQKIICQLHSLTPDRRMKSVFISVRTNSCGEKGVITASAELPSGNTIDPVSKNNTVKREFIIKGCPGVADLQVYKSEVIMDSNDRSNMSVDQVAVKFRMRVRNIGPNKAHSTKAVFVLSENLDFLGNNQPPYNSRGCKPEPGNKQKIICPLHSFTPDGKMKSVFISARTNSCGEKGAITASAELPSGNITDPVPSNNIVERKFMIEGCKICTDSDGGINYLEQGTAEARWNGQASTTDFCNEGLNVNRSRTEVQKCSGPGCYVIDYHCNASNIMTWKQKLCSSCNYGACTE